MGQMHVGRGMKSRLALWDVEGALVVFARAKAEEKARESRDAKALHLTIGGADDSSSILFGVESTANARASEMEMQCRKQIEKG